MIKNLATYFVSDFKHWPKVDLFKTLIYLFLLVNALTLLPIANDVYGYNGLAGTKGFVWNGSGALLNLLSHPVTHNHVWITWCFIIGQIVFLGMGILRIYPKLSAFAIWFLSTNLFLKGALFFTGGEVLLNIILFYFIFVQKPNPDSKYYWIENVLNNTFFILVLFQICTLYFFSFFWKLFDENWLNGMAMYYISQIDTFSSGWLAALFENKIWMSKIATYSVLVYQGSFILLVWVKKIKVPFLILGTLFHLAISFGMGIFAFGIIMSLTYLLFLDTNQIEYIRKKLKFKNIN
ncbi:MAG: hypothetical protein ACWA41_12885 [Putridiphycobacter sp.]